MRLITLYGQNNYNYSRLNDDRVLLEWEEEQQSFSMANTTLCDSGTYILYVSTYYLSKTFEVNAIVAGRLKKLEFTAGSHDTVDYISYSFEEPSMKKETASEQCHEI